MELKRESSTGPTLNNVKEEEKVEPWAVTTWRGAPIFWNQQGVTMRWAIFDADLSRILGKAIHKSITIERQNLPLRARAPMWGSLGHLFTLRYGGEIVIATDAQIAPFFGPLARKDFTFMAVILRIPVKNWRFTFCHPDKNWA